MATTQRWESLHNHTVASDGQLTHGQFMEEAGRCGYGIVAFTDHDTLIPQDVMDELRTRTTRPSPAGSTAVPMPEWISGVELSSGVNAPSSSVHIVGLFCDNQNPTLVDHCSRLHSARIARAEEYARNLRKVGFDITADDCLAQTTDGGSVGRPHVAKALLSKRRNAVVIDRLIRELRMRSQRDTHMRKLLHEVNAAQTVERKLYPLVLGENSFRNCFVPYLYWANVEETARIIRGAGGVALLAHFWTCAKELPIEAVDKLIESKTIDGLEVVFQNPPVAAARSDFSTAAAAEIVRRHPSCIAAGGGDIHACEGISGFVSSGLAAMTVGLTCGILNSGLVSAESVAASSSLGRKGH